ncbi:MAG: serine/threonine-protein kinase [Deltaproteobacteria bacterium]|nr:serine/threonine-protein kinase [Deltaproteobacteria bacterium]
MTPDRWVRVKKAFQEALSQDPARRETFLQARCGEDHALRREVERLLKLDDSLESGHSPPSGLENEVFDEVLKLLADPSQGNPEIELLPPQQGKRLGPYEIGEQIGRGGMGVVYQAHRADGRFRRRVAIKRIRHGLATEEMRRRFRLERQILGRLEHPHIAQILDGGVGEDDQPYLVMEFVEGIPIDLYCQHHELPMRARVDLLRMVCEAIQFAHQNLVVHRDLKPSNILVTEDGVPKLLDFGIAKLLPQATETDLPETRLWNRRITPEYASPEQFMGAAITTASDVYSLGIVAYEVLTDHRPFDFTALSPGEIENRILERQPARPSSRVESPRRRRRLVGDLDTILLRALHKEPGRRYPSAGSLAKDFKRHLEGLPVEARPDTFLYRMGKFLRRNKVAASIMALVMVSGVAVMAQSLRLARAVEETSSALHLAEREGNKAEEVLEFLVGLFEVANPWEGGGEDVTVREVLGLGADRVEDELESQPEVQATLMSTLGRVYLQLGLLEEASPLLEKSLTTRRRLLGEEHPEVAESLDYLGRLRRNTGDWQAAEETIRQALEMRRRVRGDAHPEVAQSLNNLGLLLQRTGRYEEAREPLEEALEIRRGQGDRPLEVAESLNNLGLLLYRTGQAEMAESLLREAVSVHEGKLGSDHPDLANSLQNLAMVLRQQRNGEAEQAVRRVLEIQRSRLGPEHPVVVATLKNLALVLADQGAYEKAVDITRQALHLHRQRLGQEHPKVAGDLGDLGSLLHAMGDLAGAEESFRQALGLRRRILPANHPELASSLIGLGSLLVDQGKVAKAEPLLREGLEVRRSVFPTDHWRIALAESVLAGALTELGRREKARVLLAASTPIILERFGPEHRHSLRALGRVQRFCSTNRDPSICSQSLSATS